MTPEAQNAFDNLRCDTENQKRLEAEATERRTVERAVAREAWLSSGKIRTDVHVGVIAEDCALHIGEMIVCDPVEDICVIKSMFDGVERHCSLYHCGVVVQTPEDVELKKRLYAEGGMKAISKHYWSTEPNEYRPEEFQDGN